MRDDTLARSLMASTVACSSPTSSASSAAAAKIVRKVAARLRQRIPTSGGSFMNAFLHALQNNPGCKVGRCIPNGRRIRGRARWEQNGADTLRDHPADEQYGAGEGGDRGKRAPEHGVAKKSPREQRNKHREEDLGENGAHLRTAAPVTSAPPSSPRRYRRNRHIDCR